MMSHMRWMMDTYRWQAAQGRFFAHQHSGNLPRNAEICAMTSILVSCVDCWRTFITNCEETHINLSKLNCRSPIAENCIVAMIRGLRQALTRIGCLQASESGPTVEEPCPAEMADYDHVHYDNVTGASFPSKSREEAMQLEVKYMKEMNVYTPCEDGAVKGRGLTPIGTRWVFTNKGDTEHPFTRARLVAQETKRTTKMDLTDTSMTVAATPPVEGFRFLLSRDELVLAFFDIPRAHFHSPVRGKVAIRMQGDPAAHLEELYPSGKESGMILSHKIIRQSVTQCQNNCVLFFVMVIHFEKTMERLNSGE